VKFSENLPTFYVFSLSPSDLPCVCFLCLLLSLSPQVLDEVKAISNVKDSSIRKIFVRELAWKTSSETLRKVFEQFGEVVEASVVCDRLSGRSRGFGFVTFATSGLF
jgi:hypothetical protein